MTGTQALAYPGRGSTGSRALAVAGLLAAAWVAGVVVVAGAGWFGAGGDGPPWPLVLAAVVPVAVLAQALRRPAVAGPVLGLDPQLVVAVQLWRVVGAAFLFGWADGTLDAAFAVPAGIGDIATGVAALVVLTRLRAGTLTRRGFVAFTALGVGDFAVALATGALVRPEAIEQLPWVLFPALAVPTFSLAHLISWRQLYRSLQPGPRVSATSPRSTAASARASRSGTGRVVDGSAWNPSSRTLATDSSRRSA